MDQSSPYLQANATVNFDHPRVMEFVRRNTTDGETLSQRIIELYYAVRDQIHYDPYRITLTVPGLCASTTIDNAFAWCVPKAALLAACCRAIHVPAALGYADVRNHITTDRLKQRMQSDIFYWHGYTNIYLNGKWVKATPAFNLSLCDKLRIKPLDFDGRSDSIFQPFDRDGHLHMEYLNDHGFFDAIPVDEIRSTFASAYPDFMSSDGDSNFADDTDTNY